MSHFWDSWNAGKHDDHDNFSESLRLQLCYSEQDKALIFFQAGALAESGTKTIR